MSNIETETIKEDNKCLLNNKTDKNTLLKISITKENNNIKFNAEEIPNNYINNDYKDDKNNKDEDDEDDEYEDDEYEDEDINIEKYMIKEKEDDEYEDEDINIEKYMIKEKEDDNLIFYNKKDKNIILKDVNLLEKYKKVIKKIKKNEPNLIKILNEPLIKEDRVNLVTMYNIYSNLYENTEEWSIYRKKINSYMKEAKRNHMLYSKYNKKERKEKDKLAKKLSNKYTDLTLYYKILDLNCDDKIKALIYRKYEELKTISCFDEEHIKLKGWLTWVVDIPHNTIKELPFNQNDIRNFLRNVSKKLDDELYGMTKVKEQILIFLNSRITNPYMKRCNLGLIGPPGVGKCLGKDTKVIMFNGTLKNVQDVCIGDMLMGDDSHPRIVMNITRGKELMYKIEQKKGVDYIVNSSHILSLIFTKDIIMNNICYNEGNIIDISLKDYLNLPKNISKYLYGYKVDINFSYRTTTIDPYTLGYLLVCMQMTNNKNVLYCNNINVLNRIKKTLPVNLYLEKFTKNTYNILTYLTSRNDSYQSDNITYNYNIETLNDLISLNKIPNIYLSNNKKNRLLLLAGLIDGNGYYNKNKDCYEIIYNKNENINNNSSKTFSYNENNIRTSTFIENSDNLLNDILFLSRSLGFYTKIKIKCNFYTKIIIKGNIGIIPVYNISNIPIHKKIKNKKYLITPINVKKLKIDDYYGFVIDKNHRFLLGDCTVTHNTSIARLISQVLDFPFEQISAGSATNDSYIKGHSYTYIGSGPGEIIKCLNRMKCKNGILFFDEFEKSVEHPEVRNTMLQISDPIQNHVFTDTYINFPVDLSCLWQIYSMNNIPTDNAITDRLFFIEIDGYNHKDKIEIIQKFLLPKALKNVGLDINSININNDVSSYLIKNFSSNDDKGIRSIEKNITNLINKLNFILKNQNDNGNFDDFNNITFNLNYKLNIPFYITIDIIDKLLDKINNNSYTFMYI
jgi:ATP-dependent Lon protease